MPNENATYKVVYADDPQTEVNWITPTKDGANLTLATTKTAMVNAGKWNAVQELQLVVDCDGTEIICDISVSPTCLNLFKYWDGSAEQTLTLVDQLDPNIFCGVDISSVTVPYYTDTTTGTTSTMSIGTGNIVEINLNSVKDDVDYIDEYWCGVFSGQEQLRLTTINFTGCKNIKTIRTKQN